MTAAPAEAPAVAPAAPAAATRVSPPASATRRVHDFAPIGLEELVERASLQTRVDRKYVVPVAALDGILADIAASGETGGAAPESSAARVLELGGIRDFRYESVYFDTPDLRSFWMAAHARRRRFKMRTRSYVDSATAYLEVKTRGARSATVKDRLEYEFADRALLNPHGLDYVHDTLDTAGFDDIEPENLVATLITRYRRTTLFVPGDGLRPESRATIDTHLSWAIGDGGTRAGRGHALDTPGIVIVETKSGSRASAVDRILWAHGHRPATISKYGTGLAALRPELTANKWSRMLRRHFAPGQTRPAASPSSFPTLVPAS
ncbi:polyphosphate polymerase domain-containing protein [Herbiconiux daphne]|uniref:Polyphosphate polymerase domain-containing protein n=1 Tax=Herbiconiux daphne TaxID=2970914 RepID=A0ABT2H8M5_9MICO|nr:polyphosphate polymerase domain-containing protein [Herbiconiux daphne]MCS5736267.1 polyphosphate polymerase domain-containing protein [Herbiconiux daphne]